MVIKQLIDLNDSESILYSLKKTISTILKDKFNFVIDLNQVEVTKTQDPKFGDITCNIALKISKEIGKNPREIAEVILNGLGGEFLPAIFAEAKIAGLGFLNLTYSNKSLFQNLEEIISKNFSYGRWKLAKGKVMVEFGQPNTHKAMTAGHIKSGVSGLSVSRILENLGYKVIQANYYSDIGLNSAKCTWAYAKNGEPEDFNNWSIEEKMQYIAKCYVQGNKAYKDDEKAAEEIKKINKNNYEGIKSEHYNIYLKLRDISILHQEEIFNKLGIRFDIQYPESLVSKEGTEIVRKNIGKVFIEDQGAIIFPGEKYNLNRWVFISNQGLPTYSGKDLGLAYRKLKEFDLQFSLVLTSVEQTNYFNAVIKALELIDKKFENKYYHLGYGWLLRENKKMSSKLGNGVGISELFEDAYKFSREKISAEKKLDEEKIKNIVEKVVLAGLKFLFLSREFHIDINYDPKQFLNPEGFSGPYVLYAYVRAKSILRQSDLEKPFAKIIDPDSVELTNEEITILRLLMQYPQITLQAGKTISPHLIAFYLFELAQSFNKFYKENKVLVDDENTRMLRLKIVEATSIVLKNGLNLLGIETIEEM
jgi:arginyl-tRNA synthetase